MNSVLKEWREYLSEFYYHDPDTGHFTAKKPGVVKSLTKKGARSRGIDAKYAERGVVTANDKIQAKFGMNNLSDDSCGRKQISGDDIPAKYKCSDYKKLYEDDLILDEIQRLLSVNESDGDASVCDKCVKSFLLRIQRANAALDAAKKGKAKTRPN